MDTPTNFSTTPDYLIGIEKGQQVLVPLDAGPGYSSGRDGLGLALLSSAQSGGGLKVQLPFNGAPNTATLFGDSRMARWRSLAPTISERNPGSWLTWMLAYSGERVIVVDDQSAGGSQWIGAGTGTDVLLTQVPACIASGAANAIGDCGVNDFFQQGSSLAAVQAVVLQALNMFIAAGMRVFLVTSKHPNSAYSSYSVSAQGKLLAYNEWLRTRVASKYARYGITIIDLASITLDPSSATVSARTNYLFDNIHSRNLGAMEEGFEAARVISLTLPEIPRLVASNADNQTYSASSTNILDNGMFIAGATLATGFTSTTPAGGGTTDSLVAHPDGYGNVQRRVITFAANNDSTRMFTGDLKARVADGDWLQMGCEIIPSAMTATRCIRGQLTLTGASTSLTATTMQLDGTNDLAMTRASRFVLWTNPIQVNLATLGALSIVQGNIAAFGSGVGGVTLDIGRMAIRRLPTS